jgi:uncharacterized protein (DUF736 family)
MSNYQKKNGDFVLFPTKMKKSEKSPDYTGNIFFDGKTYSLAAWNKTSKAGNKFWSGLMGDEIDEEKSNNFGSKVNSKPANQELDDEIPF